MKNFLLLLYGITLLSLSSCGEEKNNSSDPLQVSKIEGKQLPVKKSLTEDEDIKSFIDPYKNRIKGEMNMVLSYTNKTLSKSDGEYNTAIGNMMADAVMEFANPIFKERTGNTIDGVLLNHGGIRSKINRGDITTQTAYNIMPFENEAVVVALKGSQVLKMFEYLSRSKRAHPISGMQLILNSKNQIKTARVQGKKVDPSKTYYIVTNDYLMEGGDNMKFFSQRESEIFLDYKLRNIFIDYFKKHDTIQPVRDERFIKE